MPLSQRRVALSTRLPPKVAGLRDELCRKTGRNKTRVIASAIEFDWRRAGIFPVRRKKAH